MRALFAAVGISILGVSGGLAQPVPLVPSVPLPAGPVPAAQSCPGEAAAANAPDAVKKLYAAAAKNDDGAFHAVATSDFYAFDNGVRRTAAEFLAQAHARGSAGEWTVTEPQVETDCQLAWLTWTNKGASAAPKAPASLESAGLKFDHGAWRVAFLQTCRAPQ